MKIKTLPKDMLLYSINVLNVHGLTIFLWKPRTIFLQIVLLVLSISSSTIAQEPEYRLKAGFIEKFTRFIEWPEESAISDTSAPFVIAVIGNNPFGRYFEEISDIKKIKSKQIEIRYLSNLDEINGSHILFIANSEKKRLEEILNHTNEKTILIIGDTPGFSEEGVHINFYQVEDYLRFEINYQAVKQSRLGISSRLLKMAKII